MNYWCGILLVAAMAQLTNADCHNRINQELLPLLGKAFKELENKLEPSYGKSSPLVKGIEEHVKNEISLMKDLLEEYDGTAKKMANFLKEAEENVKHYTPEMKIALNIVVGEKTKALFPVLKDLISKEQVRRKELIGILNLLKTDNFGVKKVDVAEIFASITTIAENIIRSVLNSANQITNQEAENLTALLLPFREVLGEMYHELINGINETSLNQL